MLIYLGIEAAEPLDNGIRIVNKISKLKEKPYFLKDISPTVRITPANQLQVNYSQPPQYLTREEFIVFLIEKKKQSFERRLKKAQAALMELEKGNVLGKITLKELINENNKQEGNIKNL